MRLRTTLGAAAAVVGIGVLSFGGVSLAQTGDPPDAGGTETPAAEAPTDLDAAWDALDTCLTDKVTEPADDASDEEWEAFEEAADAVWDDCVSTLTPEQQAAIQADEEVWTAFDECIDAAVDWESEPGDDVAESEWRKFDEQILAAEKPCADQLPEDERAEFTAEFAEHEAWMAFDRCLSDQGVASGEPSLDTSHADWQAFEDQWEAAEEACADLMPEDEWCDEDAGVHGDEEGEEDGELEGDPEEGPEHDGDLEGDSDKSDEPEHEEGDDA